MAHYTIVYGGLCEQHECNTMNSIQERQAEYVHMFFPGGHGSGGTVGRPVIGKSGLIPRLHVKVTLCKILLHLPLPYLNSVISSLPLRQPASRSAIDFGRLEQQSTLICDQVGQHAM